MGLLPADRIEAVYNAAIATGLASQQDALLAGLPQSFTTTLPQASTPAGRLHQTLHTLNDVPVLDDKTVPLAVWLRAAAALTRARTEARVFQVALAELRQSDCDS